MIGENGEVLGEMWFMRMMWVCSEMVVLVMVENDNAGLWMGMVIWCVIGVENGNIGVVENGNAVCCQEW